MKMELFPVVQDANIGVDEQTDSDSACSDD